MQALLERVRIVRGIGALRQRHDLHVEFLRDRKLHSAQRRVLSGGVRVEAEEEPLREAFQLPQLILRKRRAHRRDDRREAGLPQHEHVGVPLDDDRSVLLCDLLASGVEPVEQVALLEELALRRIDVLRRQRIVVVQPPRLEAAHAPARVGERKYEASREVVVAAAVDEPAGEQILLGEPFLQRAPRERRPARSEAEPERAADLLTEPARREVLPRERALLAVPQQLFVERGGAVHQLREPFLAPARTVGLRRDLLVLDLDVEALRELLDRADEVHLLDLLDERDRIAALAAAEALEGASRRRDGEAWRPLLMERAEAPVRPAGLAQ